MTRKYEQAFILPATVLLALAISIISATFAQYIVSSSQVLNMQTFKGMAQEAAGSGISYAIGCYSSGTTTWASPLKPETACGGDAIPNTSPYMSVSPDLSWRTKFTVATPTGTSVKKIISTGITEVLVNDAVVSTIKATKIVTVTTTVGTTPIASGQSITDLSTDSHSCAIANGKLYCWGLNDTGQLGTGDLGNRNVPTLVAATNTSDAFFNKVITAVAVGTGNTCAIANGQLYCWGDNTYGQLGNGTFGGTQKTPQLVPTLASRKITSLGLSQSTPGPKSACAISDGITYCWGANTNQQLAQSNGSTIDTLNRNVPTAIYGYKSGESASPIAGRKSQSASVGAHNGCSSADGKLFCWGNIDNPSTLSPVKDMSSSGAYPYNGMVYPTGVKVIGDFSCSVPTIIVCHGRSNAYGTIPSPANLNYSSPLLDYDNGDNVGSNGDGLSCAVYADVYCYGTNNGQAYPGAVTGSDDTVSRSVSKVGVGNRYGCIVPNGGLACWGDENQGQLADGSFTGSSQLPKLVAQNIIGNDNATYGSYPKFNAAGSIGAGTNHECAIANGSVFCWGHNDKGQLGIGGKVDQAEPTVIDATNFPTLFFFIPINIAKVKVVAGGDHSCLVTGSGNYFGGTDIYCWGSNSNGELGLGNTNDTDIPVRIGSGLSGNTTDISAGLKNTCSVSGGQPYCWGDRSTGIIGDGNTSGVQTTPQLVPGFSGKQVTAITVGATHACAIVNGDAYCWGSNSNGQLSNGTTGGSQMTPANGKITGGMAAAMNGAISATFTAISAGNNFTCAIINGVTGCWGKNDLNQTGTGSTFDVPVPTQIGAASNLQANAISAGNTHACAVLQGALYCWGDNTTGQVGVGTAGGSQQLPALINGGATVGKVSVNVAAGGQGSCSVSNGIILCWGAGGWGQIGNAGFVDSPAPASISSYRTKGTYSTGQIY